VAVVVSKAASLRRKKKKRDNAKEAFLPESFFRIPAPVVRHDPFSPRSSPTKDGGSEDTSSSWDPSHILRYLDVNHREYTRPDDDFERLAVIKMAKMRRSVRASIANVHMNQQGELAFALGHHVKLEEEMWSKFGSARRSSMVATPGAGARGPGAGGGGSLATWAERDNTYDPWATGVFVQEDLWKLESPRDVRHTLSVLEIKGASSLGGGVVLEESKKEEVEEKGEWEEATPPPPLRLEDVDHEDSPADTTTTTTTTTTSKRLDGSPERAKPGLAYSPIVAPKYSPRGYFEFADKDFSAPACEQGVVRMRANELSTVHLSLPSDQQELVAVPIPDVWSVRPYPHHLIAMLEGRVWPYSRSSALVWEVVTVDLVWDICWLALTEERELKQRAEEEAERERLRLELEAAKASKGAGVLGALGGSAKKSLKSVVNMIKVGGRLFGGSSRKSSVDSTKEEVSVAPERLAVPPDAEDEDDSREWDSRLAEGSRSLAEEARARNERLNKLLSFGEPQDEN